MDWCDKCYNSGRIGSDSVIQYCKCYYGKKLKSANYKLLFQKSQLPTNLIKLSLEDFMLKKNYKTGDNLTQPQINLKKYAKHVVTSYEKQIFDVLRKKDVFLPLMDGGKYSGNNIFFYGGEESGKTMLAVHILKVAVYRAQTNTAAYYIMWDDLLSDLIPFGGDWKSLIDRCKNCGILCIDSVGKSDVSHDTYSHVHARLNMIVKNRLLQNKPTIITSNYSPETFLRDTGNIFNSLIKKSLRVKLDNTHYANFNDKGGF